MENSQLQRTRPNDWILASACLNQWQIVVAPMAQLRCIVALSRDNGINRTMNFAFDMTDISVVRVRERGGGRVALHHFAQTFSFFFIEVKCSAKMMDGWGHASCTFWPLRKMEDKLEILRDLIRGTRHVTNSINYILCASLSLPPWSPHWLVHFCQSIESMQ